MVFPHLAGTTIERVEQAAGALRVWASTRAREVACHACGRPATRVHSRYDRRLADAAVAGQTVELRLRVRRLFCDSSECEVVTFTEQPAAVAAPWARRTPLARGMLESVSRAVAGRASARLTAALGMPVSRNTLVRLLQALPDPPTGPVTVLGVDDWAIRRGQSYATVLVDMATRQPVDVLPDREADTLVDWLTQHPEVEVITRDRSSAYAEAASRGAPQAVQCADRWHLLKNLGEAVEKTVTAHRACLPEPAGADAADDDAAADNAVASSLAEMPPPAAFAPEPVALGEKPESSWETRIRERFAAVQALRIQGKGIREIARELELDRKTARRHALAGSADELVAKTTSRRSLLDEFKPYLHQRWNAGHTNIAHLVAEIRERGYSGSAQIVYRHLRPFRTTGTKAPTPKPKAPRIREVTGWIMRAPENLPDDHGQRLKAILARCPALAAARHHVGAFACMIRDLRGDRLPAWMEAVLADDLLPALRTFVNGLRQDLAAVTAGLTLPYSNGPTEGTVNKIKALKRMSYGRCGFSLLRKKILHAL